ncbi:CHAT domain-containing protein [Myxococcus sp. RHSTA-1-4]|uniref:CHAT domain-containing protein n=1 Tax=Myxococcus sp. RHSTA-1-4 TaxID=2874601 RepID=UPI001CBBEE2B|nr:CHAT domain-containing protein [Myxococcus sp. RHSTA-1-4]MBZ4422986.1 CHAT domain-containing protein [Myxococcus sp. RHSTA-1-4]
MAITRYRRFDIRVVLQRSEDGGTVGETRVWGVSLRHAFTPEEVERWCSGAGPTADELSTALRLPGAVERLSAFLKRERAPEDSERFLARVAFEVRDSRWEAFDLEAVRAPAEVVLREEAPDLSIPVSVVRASPVRPRIGLIPLTLPVRVLALDARGGTRGAVSGLVSAVFGSLPGWKDAMDVDACEPEVLEPFLRLRGWPTAEVLHFSDPAFFRREAEAGRLFSTAAPDAPGTLGWLFRMADAWQTRLVVLEYEHEGDARMLRRLAHALVGRGGPAVLLGPAGASAWRARLYDELVHDRPLDAWGEPGCVLLGGAGREELLRASTIAAALARPAVEEELILANPKVEEALRTELHGMADLLTTLNFDHESGGMLPLSQKLGNLRDQLMVPSPRPPVLFSFASPGGTSLESAPAPEPRPGPRQVNTLLHVEAEDGGLRELEATSTALEPAQVVHLSVRIDSKRGGIPSLGSMALLEERLHWTLGEEGLFLDVGVTGMDFDVLGAPVQQLWLPRKGASDAVFFALALRSSTRIEGVARLRLCLYQRDNLLQSFRLAVRVRRPGEDEGWEARARRLADALGVDVAQVLQSGETGSLIRLEYSAVAELSERPDAPPRALSFAVNQSAGQDVVTVKGQDLFEVKVGGNLGKVVEDVRKTLLDSSRGPQGQYLFNFQGEANRGDPAQFKKMLLELARHGWSLFTQLVPSFDGRAEVRKRLTEDGQVINAAHMDLERVIPWALVYDRPFDADRQTPAPVTCDAPLPGADGSPGAKQCGASERCPLHETNRATTGHTEKTVACPRHFWGFRHMVEVPPQQVARLDEPPRALPPVITSGDPVTVLTGRHEGLGLAVQHFTELASLLGTTPPLAVLRAAKGRDDLLDLLEGAQGAPDIVYLYCHAYARRPPNARAAEPDEPHLALGPASAVGWITASQLASLPPLSHQPLFFLNGCGTAAFDSTRPAQIILSLMAARAGGVIGTEVAIWEGLAAEMARLFFQHFLKRKPAGESLLEARRALLARYNPLGLVYTLYGSANLMLAPGRQPAPSGG